MPYLNLREDVVHEANPCRAAAVQLERLPQKFKWAWWPATPASQPTAGATAQAYQWINSER